MWMSSHGKGAEDFLARMRHWRRRFGPSPLHAHAKRDSRTRRWAGSRTTPFTTRRLGNFSNICLIFRADWRACAGSRRARTSTPCQTTGDAQLPLSVRRRRHGTRAGRRGFGGDCWCSAICPAGRSADLGSGCSGGPVPRILRPGSRSLPDPFRAGRARDPGVGAAGKGHCVAGSARIAARPLYDAKRSFWGMDAAGRARCARIDSYRLELDRVRRSCRRAGRGGEASRLRIRREHARQLPRAWVHAE